MGALKVLVAVMGVLIVAATVTLVVLIVQRAGGDSAAVRLEVALRQPSGSSIGGLAEVEGRLAVWVRRADGDRVVLVDARRGTVVGEVRLGE